MVETEYGLHVLSPSEVAGVAGGTAPMSLVAPATVARTSAVAYDDYCGTPTPHPNSPLGGLNLGAVKVLAA